MQPTKQPTKQPTEQPPDYRASPDFLLDLLDFWNLEIGNNEEILQIDKVRDLKQNKKIQDLEGKFNALEKFVVRLEEHLVMLAQNQRYTNKKKLDYSLFDKLHPLMRSKSLEMKWVNVIIQLGTKQDLLST